MMAALRADEYRFSAALEAVVRSQQFRFRRDELAAAD